MKGNIIKLKMNDEKTQGSASDGQFEGLCGY